MTMSRKLLVLNANYDKSVTLLAWLRGPAPTDYFHSEGACCSADTVDGVPGAHKRCVVDIDFSFRKHYDLLVLRGDGAWGSQLVPDWCEHCQGYDPWCVFCHTAKELLDWPLSQREFILWVLAQEIFHHPERDLPRDYVNYAQPRPMVMHQLGYAVVTLPDLEWSERPYDLPMRGL